MSQYKEVVLFIAILVINCQLHTVTARNYLKIRISIPGKATDCFLLYSFQASLGTLLASIQWISWTPLP
jgi:hypothetical protein